MVFKTAFTCVANSCGVDCVLAGTAGSELLCDVVESVGLGIVAEGRAGAFEDAFLGSGAGCV